LKNAQNCKTLGAKNTNASFRSELSGSDSICHDNVTNTRLYAISKIAALSLYIRDQQEKEKTLKLNKHKRKIAIITEKAKYL
jgi:hypothetical protein